MRKSNFLPVHPGLAEVHRRAGEFAFPTALPKLDTILKVTFP